MTDDDLDAPQLSTHVSRRAMVQAIRDLGLIQPSDLSRGMNASEFFDAMDEDGRMLLKRIVLSLRTFEARRLRRKEEEEG